MRPRIILGTAAFLLVAAALVIPQIAPFARRCEAIHGGTPGAAAQLRFVDADDGHVTFTFGTSAGPSRLGVPEFVLDPVVTPPDADGTMTFALHFTDASAINPDGSPSYFGATTLRPGPEHITRLALIGDADRKMEWRLALGRVACPKVEEGDAYAINVRPRVQLILTIGDLRTITVEPDSRPSEGGSGTGYRNTAPVTVAGHGFSGGKRVSIALGSRMLIETSANGAGSFVVGAYIPPDVAPGNYTLVARDDGGSAAVPFTVTVAPKPLELP